jgi:hypothetical protein
MNPFILLQIAAVEEEIREIQLKIAEYNQMLENKEAHKLDKQNIRQLRGFILYYNGKLAETRRRREAILNQ